MNITTYNQNNLNTSDFQEKIRNRVKDIIFDLIPDEELDKMVANEYTSYFLPRKVKAVHTQIKAYLKINMQNYHEMADRVLPELVESLTPHIIEGMHKHYANTVLDAIRYSIPHNNLPDKVY